MPEENTPTAPPDLVAALEAAEQPAEAPPVEPTLPVEPAAAPAEAEPIASAAEPAEPAAGQPTATDDEQRRLIKFVDEGWGQKFGEKYRDDAELITGMVEASRLVGRRDADAEFGRAIRQHEPAFQQFLQQRQQAQQPQQPLAQQAPPAWEEICRWQDIVAREGENAPPDVKRSLEEATQNIQRAAYEFAYHRDKVLAEPVKKLAAPVADEITQQQQARAQDTHWFQVFEQQHAPWIYRDGRHTQDNMTPDGQRLMALAGLEKQRGRRDAEALHYAHQALMIERMQQQQAQQSQPTQPVKPAAQHQPAVAAPAGGDPEAAYAEDRNTMGLADLLEKWCAQKEAVAGQLG